MTKPDYTAVSQAELCRIIGHPIQVFQRWLPNGCPFGEDEQGRKTYCVSDVFKWRVEHERELAEDRNDARTSRTENRLYEQRIRKAKADADKVERQNLVTDGVLLLREDVERDLRAAGAMIKAVAKAEQNTRTQEDFNTGADITRLLEVFAERVHDGRTGEVVGRDRSSSDEHPVGDSKDGDDGARVDSGAPEGDTDATRGLDPGTDPVAPRGNAGKPQRRRGTGSKSTD